MNKAKDGRMFQFTYPLGFLVLIHCLVRSIRKLDMRPQLRDNEVAALTHQE